MNIKELFKNKIAIIVSAIAICLLFIPLPAIVLEVLFAIEMVGVIIALVLALAGKVKRLPEIFVYLILAVLIIAVSFTRFTLISYENGDTIKLNNFICKTICSENFVLGFFTALILLIVQIFLITKGITRVIEVAARFCLDGMNSTLFDIDSRLSKIEITSEEAEKEKRQLMEYADFYSQLDGCSKLLKGNFKVICFILIVNLAGGLLIEMVKLGKSFAEAIEPVMNGTATNMIIFLFPLVIISFAMCISAEKKEKIKIVRDYPVMEGNPEIVAGLKKMQEELQNKNTEEK